jgi:hypothetical protein
MKNEKLLNHEVSEIIHKIKQINDEISILITLTLARPKNDNYLFLKSGYDELVMKDIKIPISIEKGLFDLINESAEKQILIKREEIKKLTNDLNKNL